jgi:hypothetical protein
MPISPENRARYPKDWKEIRERILKRARNKCELCGVPNGVYRWTDEDGDHTTTDEMRVETLTTCDGVAVSRIVLTIAHWENMDPADCRDENLKAACQRCHNRHDVPHRTINRAATRKRGKARADLFEGPA